MDCERRKIHFFFPTYFDGPIVLALVHRMQDILSLHYKPHFHILDDSAGKDLCLSQSNESSSITVYRMPSRVGHQRAFVSGLRKFLSLAPADSELIITMDGDGQDKPEDALRLLAVFERQRDEELVCLAERYRRRDSLWFRTLLFFYQTIFWGLTGRRLKTGNFALFSVAWAKENLFNQSFDGCYSGSLLAKAKRKELVPCLRDGRWMGESRMGYMRLLRHGFSMLSPFKSQIVLRSLILSSVIAAGLFFLTAPHGLSASLPSLAPIAWERNGLGVASKSQVNGGQEMGIAR